MVYRFGLALLALVAANVTDRVAQARERDNPPAVACVKLSADGPTNSGAGTSRLTPGNRPPFEAPGASAIVSIDELQHGVPRKALDEFQKAMKAQASGETSEAIGHLQKAVRIDPAFYEAFNNLGVYYMYTSDFQLAMEHFTKAIGLRPHRATAFTNLSIACLMVNKFEDAERAARQALNLDRVGLAGRLLLGYLLVLQRKFTAEAEQNLRKAAADYPLASLILAPVLVSNGDVESAREHLRRYLSSGEGQGVEFARTWLARLSKPSQQ